jgi:hypothetical protein
MKAHQAPVSPHSQAFAAEDAGKDEASSSEARHVVQVQEACVVDSGTHPHLLFSSEPREPWGLYQNKDNSM